MVTGRYTAEGRRIVAARPHKEVAFEPID